MASLPAQLCSSDSHAHLVEQHSPVCPTGGEQQEPAGSPVCPCSTTCGPAEKTTGLGGGEPWSGNVNVGAEMCPDVKV